MRLFQFGKKAQVTHEVFYTILELLMLALFLGFGFYFVMGEAQNTTFEKNYLARDLALSLSTITIAPANIYYSYLSDRALIQKFVYLFQPQKVTVKGLQPEDLQAQAQTSQNQQKIFHSCEELNPNAIRLTSLGNHLLPGQDIPLQLNLLNCPHLTLKQSFTLHPASDHEKIKELFSQLDSLGLPASELLTLEQALQSSLSSSHPPSSSSSPSQILILIRDFSSYEQNNPIKIFIPKDYWSQNSPLACQLINSILQYNNFQLQGITSTNLIATSWSQNILLIELGNSQTLEDENNLLNHPQEVAHSLSQILTEVENG